MIFFAYIGFDAVSTAAQEAKNPQNDMPIGILGSLVICTVLYILVSGLLTGIVPYTTLNVADPVAVGIDATGVRWGSVLVKLGAICRTGQRDAGDAAGPVAGVLLDVARWPAAGVGRRGASPLPHAVDLDSITVGMLRCDFRSADSDRHPGGTGEHWNPAGVRDRVRGRMGSAASPSRAAPAVQDPHGAAGAHPRNPGFAWLDGQPAVDTWLRLIVWLVSAWSSTSATAGITAACRKLFLTKFPSQAIDF